MVNFKQKVAQKYTISYSAYHPDGTRINTSPYGHSNLGLNGASNGEEVTEGDIVSVTFESPLTIGGYDSSQNRIKFKSATITSGKNTQTTTNPDSGFSVTVDGDVIISAYYELIK